MGPEWFVVGGLVLLPLVWLFANYNRFVRLRNHLTESWSNVDVELKRRYELVPNLVATVKGYAAHEKDVLERVTVLRDQAASNHGGAASQAASEAALELGLKGLFAVVEGYPALKSDAHFLALQKELALTEDRIAAARRFYNGNVRDMKSLCEQFPTNVLASVFGFTAPGFFSAGAEERRRVTVGE